jgi:hemerythrin-like domain-containing protein
MEGHMKDEERTLFPFLRVHIPRLEPMVYLLLSEHEDFRNCLQGLKKSIRQAKKGGASTAVNIERICEQGTYFICMLRSHMWVESHSLHRAADKELRLSEKKKLIQQIRH